MNWHLLANSLLVSVSASLLAVTFGFLAGLFLMGMQTRWRNRILAVAIIALALPPFVVTNCWLHYLGAAGPWRRWLPFNIMSLPGAIWLLALMLWPFALLLISSTWTRLEPSQLESDPALTGRHLIRVLLLPVARPALVQSAVLIFVLALNNFSVPAILQVKVLPAELWVRFSTNFDTLGALQLSWPLVGAPFLVALWLMRRDIRLLPAEGAVSPKLLRQQLGMGWFEVCAACTFLLCALSVALPVFELVSVKRTWIELPGAIAAGKRALWNSALFAGASAACVIGLSLVILLAFELRVHKRRVNTFSALEHPWPGRSVLAALLWLPFLVPGVLLGVCFVKLLNRPWLSLFYQSQAIVIFAFVLRYMALGWTVVSQARESVDRDLIDAARLEGASPWQMLRQVHWPQIASQVAAGWYIVFLLCLWDVESMILVYPPGSETLALRVFNLLHYGYGPQISALCLALLALAVAPLILWKALQSRGGSKFGTRSSRLLPLSLGLGGVLLFGGCAPKSTENNAAVVSQIFDRVQVIGTRGVGVGQLNKPRSVAVDVQDNFYVVDMTGRVQKFSPSGAFVLSWQMPQTDLGKPKGMCRDQQGNIVVVEPHYQRVNHFSPDGRLLLQWGGNGTNVGQFKLPRAVAINSRGEAFVSEYGAMERVQRFSGAGVPPATARSAASSSIVNSANAANQSALAAHGDGRTPAFASSFGKPGNSPGEFNRAEGLCVDTHDRVYVADSCNHRIQIFSSDGQFIRAYGKAGSAKGELSYPYDICVDAAGRQYVCEFGNSRIQIFDVNDQPLEIIGGPGAEPGRFSNPWGVALDSKGNLYVADSQNHRVQKLIRKESVAEVSPKSKVQSPKSGSDTHYFRLWTLDGARNSRLQ